MQHTTRRDEKKNTALKYRRSISKWYRVYRNRKVYSRIQSHSWLPIQKKNVNGIVRIGNEETCFNAIIRLLNDIEYTVLEGIPQSFKVIPDY